MTTPDNTELQNHIAAEDDGSDATAPEQPDPVDQALTFLGMLSRGERIMQRPSGNVKRNHLTDCTLALGAVGIAIAYQLTRLADAAETHNTL